MGDIQLLEELTKNTNELMKQKNMLRHFFKHPTKELYQSIRINDEIYQSLLGTNKYKMFIWAVCETYPNFEEALDETTNLDYQLEVDRLLDPRNILTTLDLDILWILYYATGNNTFTNRVKSVVCDELQYVLVRSAANWSYNSHVNQGLLDPKYILEINV